MKTKEQQIEEYLKEPIKVGDEIVFQGDGSGSKVGSMKSLAEVLDVKNNKVYFQSRYSGHLINRDISEVEKSFRHIGANPFKEYKRYQSYRIDIEQLFWRLGINRNSTKRFEDLHRVKIEECNLSPIVRDRNGNEVDYQRGLIWTEQQKKDLVDSVYNRMDIGKFVFRKRSYSYVENRVKQGKIENTAFSDLIDGKQRATALLDFYYDVFTDNMGNLFSDLSADAQRQFLGHMELTYTEMPEDSTDQDVIDQFLLVNHTGVPMDKSHIEYVKKIKL